MVKTEEIVEEEVVEEEPTLDEQQVEADEFELMTVKTGKIIIVEKNKSSCISVCHPVYAAFLLIVFVEVSS